MIDQQHAPPSPPSNRPHNRLLAALHREEFKRLVPYLTTVTFRFAEVIHRQGERFQHVYFLNGGVCSIVAALSNGAMVEVAATGDEGMVGIEAFFTDDPISSTDKMMIQVHGETAERVAVHDFRREIAHGGTLARVVSQWAEAKVAEYVASAACNALHPAQERCARWLLQIHDRVHQERFDLSHEFLAMMVGANRSTVSVIAATFQKAGLLRYRRGRVEIVDRQGLEAASCECYARIRQLDRWHK